MYFKLVDGKSVFATHYKDDKYFYADDEIPEGAEKVEQPSQQIIERAVKLEGTTYSKSEFEKILFSTAKEEILEERVKDLEDYILMREEVL